MKNALAERVDRTLRDVPDFPKPGILFKDITPVLEDGELFTTVTNYFAERYEAMGLTKLVAIESRGFIFGAAIAHELSMGLVLARKPGKLPAEKVGVDYALEYGTDRIEVHKDALGPKDRVVVIDDLLATGGTAGATVDLVHQLGAKVVECGFLISLDFLDGAKRLNVPHHAIVHY
ncbi:MAG: adenine phosphoribosyltransferase [bacterium]